MLMPNGQIMRYSNVDWINNLPTQDTPKVKTTKYCHFPEHNLTGGLFDSQEELKNQGRPENILIPIYLNSLKKHNISSTPRTSSTTSPLSTPPLSPFPLDLEKQSHQTSKPLPTEQCLTWEQAKSKNIMLPPVSSYFSIENTSTLLSMLASANNPELYKPKSYKKATSYHCSHRKDWKKAIQDKIDLLSENNTWSLSTLPSGSRALEEKWVYKIKRKPAGKILRFKACWVVKRFSQRKGIDYNKTFALVVKPKSCKAIFALCVARDWNINHMDVKTAFFYGLVEEIIYLGQSSCYFNRFARVCKL